MWNFQPVLPRDGRQSETAFATQRGVCRKLRSRGFATLCELPLADGRRANVMGLGPKNELWIVEIKSSPRIFIATGSGRSIRITATASISQFRHSWIAI